MSEDRPVIAVIGGSGSQGGAVVRALAERGRFRVRAVSRSAATYSGPADEVVNADLTNPESLDAAFAGAHGVFALSNFTDAANDEFTQGRNAVDAAKRAGVRHFVWSTQPNVEAISGGEFEVPHFTNKARVDALVREAGFEAFTFVVPPFYFENFLTALAPRSLPDGRHGWVLPISGDAKAIHAASINDLGGVVAGAFEHPDEVGAGNYLSSAAVLTSFDEFAEALRSQGHSIDILEVPPTVYASFYRGADEMAQMMGYWVKHTYLGPTGDDMIAAARQVSTSPSTTFANWASAHMTPSAS